MEQGKLVACTSCGKEVLLPYISDGKVDITQIDGWTIPPLRCPTCSANQIREYGYSGIWEHAKGHRYLVIGLADDSNNVYPHSEPQVVYISLEKEGREGRPMHIRSLGEFLDRFKPV